MITVTLPNLKLALIDLRDQSSLAIVDLSSYAVVPSSSDVALQITAPGYQTVNVTFIPGNVNIYKCADLGITCGPTECCPLPDGIYDVNYTISAAFVASTTNGLSMNYSPSIEKTFIKIDQIKCKFQHVFLKVDLQCNCGDDAQRDYKKELKSIDLMIAGCVAAANDCNTVLAYQLYKKADQMLDNLCCKFGLTCSSIFSCPQCQ